MAYDIKFKLKSIEYHRKGNSIRNTAAVFGISTRTLCDWLKEYDEHGGFIIKSRPANNTKLDEKDVLKFLEDNPDCYQQEIASHFGISQSGISRAFKRLNITRKKR